MKNLNSAIIIAAIFIITEQPVIGYDKSADNSQPTHQGFGRIGTAIENTLTLHPGNAVNSLATGDQSDTTFGWHEDEDNRVKANRAHTKHNQNRSQDKHHADRRRDERYTESSRENYKLRKDERELRREEEDLDRELRHEEERESRKETKSRRWFW